MAMPPSYSPKSLKMSQANPNSHRQNSQEGHPACLHVFSTRHAKIAHRCMNPKIHPSTNPNRLRRVLDTQKFADMLPRSDFGEFPDLVGRAGLRALTLNTIYIYETTVSTVQTS